MKKSWSVASALVLVAVLAPSALALEIQVAPSTLVLSSPGGNLTVHTDVPYVEAISVVLAVNGTALPARTFADDCGYLVAQCSKETAKGAIGEFEGPSTTACVTLTVNGASASETIRVIRGAPER